MYIIINGAPCSGKSTFVSLCKKFYEDIFECSTVDLVKEIAVSLGWDGTKDLKNRKFLSNLKDILTEWKDIPYNDIIKRSEEHWNEFKTPNMMPITFVHCREPEEIQKFKDRLGALTVFVTRDEIEKLQTSNYADAEVYNYNYDYIVDNNGTLENLEITAERFVTEIINILLTEAIQHYMICSKEITP